MASSSSSSLQRQKRVRLERTVSLKFKDLEGFCTELSENISMGGMLLRTEAPQPPGTLFDFELTLEEGGPLIQGIGEVVWVREEDEVPGMPGGMGVRFLELAPGSRALIYQVVDRHITRGGQPFELHPRPPEETPAETPETAPVPDLRPDLQSELLPEPKPVRAGSYAVLASPQRKKDEAPAETRKRPLPRRRSSRRVVWVGLLAAVLALAVAVALWYYGVGYGVGREPEPSEPVAVPDDGAEADGVRDPLASVVPIETPRDSEPEAATEPTVADSSPIEPEPVEPAPIEPEPTEPESPTPPAATPEATATVLRDITWQRRGEALEVTLLANGPFREGWNHFRMDEGTSREVVRLIGIREPFRPTVPVDEPEVRQIRTGHHRRAGGDELHVVLDLASSRVTLLEIEAEGPRLLLLLQEN